MPNPPAPPQKPVSILVNKKPVSLPDHKTTGLQIKQAAIAQAVSIQLNFALFRVTGGTQHPVGDADEITVHDGQEFRAIAPDDNSWR